MTPLEKMKADARICNARMLGVPLSSLRTYRRTHCRKGYADILDAIGDHEVTRADITRLAVCGNDRAGGAIKALVKAGKIVRVGTRGRAPTYRRV